MCRSAGADVTIFGVELLATRSTAAAVSRRGGSAICHWMVSGPLRSGRRVVEDVGSCDGFGNGKRFAGVFHRDTRGSGS